MLSLKRMGYSWSTTEQNRFTIIGHNDELRFPFFALHLGASIGPLAMGILLDLYSYAVGYGLTATLVLIGVGLLVFGFKERPAR